MNALFPAESMGKDTVSYSQFQNQFISDCMEASGQYVVREDGAIYRAGYNIDMISVDTACKEAYKMAVAYQFSENDYFKSRVKSFLDYAGKSLICQDGYLYWAEQIPSLCAMGRWARYAIRASEIIKYDTALIWLEQLMDNWPFWKEEHRFIERFTGGSHYPTSVNCFMKTYNMVAEGVADSWMIANRTGNRSLKEKAKDVLCNFILPGQREDGLWDYCCRKNLDMGILNDGEEEYNYCLYLVYILSNLLEIKDAAVLLESPLKRAVDVLMERFMRSDGSIYAPVHWGWDHIYESTLFTSIICWRLFHYCGNTVYEPVVARGIHWLRITDMGAGNVRDKVSCVGLRWDVLFLDLLKDRFSAEGKLCTRSEAVQTLEHVQKMLSVLPPDESHKNFYFSSYVYNTYYAIQRKISRMKKEEQDILEIPMKPAGAQVDMPWQFPETCYSGKAVFSYDRQGIIISVKCHAAMKNQPYLGASMYQGDGVIVSLQDTKGNHALVNLALQSGKPVGYLYNNAIPFKGDLRLYVQSEPRGWYLKEDRVIIHQEEDGVVFHFTLLWTDLGWRAEKGDCLSGGVAITRYTPYGCQYNQWGRTDLEDADFSYSGTFRLV